jgi:hypothetical protein
MEPGWIKRKRNEELINYIKNKNDAGIMPSTRSIYNGVDMAKATALNYLSVLKAKGLIDCTRVGPTWLWYISKDDKGNTLIPKVVFVTN